MYIFPWKNPSLTPIFLHFPRFDRCVCVCAFEFEENSINNNYCLWHYWNRNIKLFHFLNKKIQIAYINRRVLAIKQFKIYVFI